MREREREITQWINHRYSLYIIALNLVTFGKDNSIYNSLVETTYNHSFEFN